MRAKKAKTLRAIARQMTVGFPECAYKEGKRGERKLERDTTCWFYKRLKQMYRDRSSVLLDILSGKGKKANLLEL